MSLFNRLMLKRLGVVPTHDVTMQRDIKVSMPDGAELLTDVYFGNAGAPAPVIVIRSPYGKGASLAAGMAYPFATQGFNVVMQCCRGRFGSKGEFDPWRNEQRDGMATLEWIKRQPWCNGSIGTYGLSYLGYTQWAVAASAGPEVKAMAMQVTTSDFSLMKFAGDSFALETSLSWTDVVTKTGSSAFVILQFLISRLFGLRSISRKQWQALPLARMDEQVLGKRVHFWQDWLQHASSRDSWWSPPSCRRTIEEVRRPITMVAGWFDIFVPWQMEDFASLRKAGCDARITVGPWAHTDFGVGHTGLHEALEWFDRHLRGKDTAPPRKPVKLYVIGADEWRHFDAWPPRECVAEHWYLQPQRQLADRLAPECAPDQYRYDPADPTPSIGGPAFDAAAFSVDNKELEARADVLTYTSEPLQQSRDLIGEVTAELYVSSTAASADFFVRLCDVDETGVSKNICDGLQRVRIEANGEPQCVHVKLWPTAYRVARGHRLRVQISSGAFPRWARNLGGLEPIGQATELHAATQSIFHSPNHPSRVILPFQRPTTM